MQFLIVKKPDLFFFKYMYVYLYSRVSPILVTSKHDVSGVSEQQHIRTVDFNQIVQN